MKLTGLSKEEKAMHEKYCKLTRQLLVCRGSDGKKLSNAQVQETQQHVQALKDQLPDISDDQYATKGH